MKRSTHLSAAFLLIAAGLVAQELPESGVLGVDAVYATSPSGATSQLFVVSLANGLAPAGLGAPVNAVPSRWAHRRRTLGALETKAEFVASMGSGLFLCPMGGAAGNGGIHLVDLRTGFPFASVLVPTGNPAGYDLAVVPSLEAVFMAEDDGIGTTLHGFSYAVPGQLIPLSPPSLALPGRPSAYCNRMGVDESALELHVPTSTGIQVVDLSAGPNHMAPGPFVPSAPGAPATNPIRFDRNGVATWIVGTSTFGGSGTPTEAGFLAWTAAGASESGGWGLIPNLSPPRPYVPAVGCEELAVVGDGTDTWAYYLLRDPSPTAFFIRPSAIGVVRFLGSAPADASTIICPDEMGEPFAIPTVHGTKVAIESSFGPPFINEPPGGGEKFSILYSPLHPIGAGTTGGVLGVPDPLGGRISTKGMDRPLWAPGGRRVIATTSHFPGAPNPAIPGLEVMDVPDSIPVDEYVAPHLVVPNLVSPNRAIVFPTVFTPRDPAAAAVLGQLSFTGGVFHDGMASAMLAPFGELGQLQPEATAFVQDPDIPNFPAVFPASFEDATGSLTPVPLDFGARRATFNLTPGFGLGGLLLSAAIGNEILVQPTGFNFLAQAGLAPGPVAPIRVSLPPGWVTTTEFVSL